MTMASSDVIFSHDPQRQMAAMKRCFGADMMNYYCCKPPKRKIYIYFWMWQRAFWQTMNHFNSNGLDWSDVQSARDVIRNLFTTSVKRYGKGKKQNKKQSLSNSISVLFWINSALKTVFIFHYLFSSLFLFSGHYIIEKRRLCLFI